MEDMKPDQVIGQINERNILYTVMRIRILYTSKPICVYTENCIMFLILPDRVS